MILMYVYKYNETYGASLIFSKKKINPNRHYFVGRYKFSLSFLKKVCSKEKQYGKDVYSYGYME